MTSTSLFLEQNRRVYNLFRAVFIDNMNKEILRSKIILLID